MASVGQDGNTTDSSSTLPTAPLSSPPPVTTTMASTTPSVLINSINPGSPTSPLTRSRPSGLDSNPSSLSSAVESPSPTPAPTSSAEQTSSLVSGLPSGPSFPPSESSIQTANIKSTAPASSSPSVTASTPLLSSSSTYSAPPVSPPSAVDTSSGSQAAATISTLPSATGSAASTSPPASPSIYAAATTNSSVSSSTTSAGTITDSPGAQPGSGRSSHDIAVIAAPVAIVAGLVPVLVLFFCWWKRRRSFRGGYHQRNRSNDTEMSNINLDAGEASHEPKAAAEQLDMVASSVPDISSTDPKQAETQTWPVNSTREPRILPGLSPNSSVGSPSSPTGTSSLSPPPYRKTDRQSDSPSLLLPDPIEPLDVTRSPKLAGSTGRPGSAHRNTTSKGQASAIAEDIDWPLPSPFRSRSPKERNSNESRLGAGGAKKAGSPKGEPPEPFPPRTMSPDRGEGVAGPSSPKLGFARPGEHTGPSRSEPNLSRQSPFDDDNADDSASNYSTSIQDKRRVSSMLDLHKGEQIDDDGVSAMTVSSRGSNRKSRLHQRTSDEISVVSSLHGND